MRAAHRAVDVSGRREALQVALDAGGENWDPAVARRAAEVLERTGRRLDLGAGHTVVALVGATGSGKSSLFNAVAGMELAVAAARRPTTSIPEACVWGRDGADALLDWLQVPHRHVTERESVLDADRQTDLRGLVLLDLPDHDSTSEQNRREVDRLIELVDLLVWVVDPQKYADELLHGGYLRRFAGHGAVMLVVLNQVDRLTEAEADTCRRDLRRLLDSDGLSVVHVLTTSARTGAGVPELRSALAQAVAGHRSGAERAAADLDAVAQQLADGLAETEPDPRRLPGAQTLTAALAQATGIPVVLDAVQAEYRRRASRWTGWPPWQWLRRRSADPLSRLRLGAAEGSLRELLAGSAAAPTPAQRARVDLAVLELCEQSASGLPERWARAVRRCCGEDTDELSEQLDAAAGAVDLGIRRPGWWVLFGVLQLLLLLAALGGLAWTATFLVRQALNGIPDPLPFVGVVSLPLLLLAGGLLGGWLLAGLGALLGRARAHRYRTRVAEQLQSAVAAVVLERVLGPIARVLADHRSAREALRPFLAERLRPSAAARISAAAADPGAEPGAEPGAGPGSDAGTDPDQAASERTAGHAAAAASGRRSGKGPFPAASAEAEPAR